MVVWNYFLRGSDIIVLGKSESEFNKESDIMGVSKESVITGVSKESVITGESKV